MYFLVFSGGPSCSPHWPCTQTSQRPPSIPDSPASAFQVLYYRNMLLYLVFFFLTNSFSIPPALKVAEWWDCLSSHFCLLHLHQVLLVGPKFQLNFFMAI